MASGSKTDVYKRQAARLLGAFAAFDVGQRRRQHLRQRLAGQAGGIGAVSYTHLDVYKRQRLARGVPAGSELEYVDAGTIAWALMERKTT